MLLPDLIKCVFLKEIRSPLVTMNFTNPMEGKKEKESRGVFFENKDMDTLAEKFLNMQR